MPRVTDQSLEDSSELDTNVQEYFDELETNQTGGAKKRRGAKKGSKKGSKKKAKKSTKKKSKKGSKKGSRKMSRGKLNPFMKFKMHVGEKIGNKGIPSASVAKVYKDKAEKDTGLSGEALYAAAKKLFDADTAANHQKHLDAALKKPRKASKKRKSKKGAEPTMARSRKRSSKKKGSKKKGSKKKKKSKK